MTNAESELNCRHRRRHSSGGSSTLSRLANKFSCFFIVDEVTGGILDSLRQRQQHPLSPGKLFRNQGYVKAKAPPRGGDEMLKRTIGQEQSSQSCSEYQSIQYKS